MALSTDCINDTIYDTHSLTTQCHFVDSLYAEWQIIYIIMVNVIMLGDIMQSVFILNAIMLNASMLSGIMLNDSTLYVIMLSVVMLNAAE